VREQRGFPRRMDALEDVMAVADGFLAAARTDEQTTFAARLAVEELFTNAVQHGVGGGEHIDVVLALENRRLLRLGQSSQRQSTPAWNAIKSSE